MRKNPNATLYKSATAHTNFRSYKARIRKRNKVGWTRADRHAFAGRWCWWFVSRGIGKRKHQGVSGMFSFLLKTTKSFWINGWNVQCLAKMWKYSLFRPKLDNVNLLSRRPLWIASDHFRKGERKMQMTSVIFALGSSTRIPTEICLAIIYVLCALCAHSIVWVW